MSDASIRTSALCVRRNHSDVRALCPTLPLGVCTLCPTVDDGAGGSICNFVSLEGRGTFQGVGPCRLRGPVPWKVPRPFGVPRGTLDVRAFCPTRPFRRPRFVSDATIRTSALCVRREHSDVRALCPTQPFGRPRFVSDATSGSPPSVSDATSGSPWALCPMV